jgi:hypothetical protein
MYINSLALVLANIRERCIYSALKKTLSRWEIEHRSQWDYGGAEGVMM